MPGGRFATESGRCQAGPLVVDEPEWVPDTGRGYDLGRLAAETGGILEAAADAATETLRAAGELIEDPPPVLRLAALLGKQSRGELTDAEREELAAMRRAMLARVDEAVALLADAPDIARAFRDYATAVERRPALTDEAYRQGLALERDVQEAHRERGYFTASILLGFAPGRLIRRLLGRRRRLAERNDPDRLAEELSSEAARLRRHPTAPDWDVIDNPGIDWTRGIQDQGLPWEDALQAKGTLGRRAPGNFKTFDFFDIETRLATSAKTLNTRAKVYRERPANIYGKLKHYVDRTTRFDEDFKFGFGFTVQQIEHRRVELAVPFDTAPEQVVQIRRAIAYAEGRGVEVKVRVVR